MFDDRAGEHVVDPAPAIVDEHGEEAGEERDDRQPEPDRQVGLAGARRAEEDDVLAGGDEVQGAEVGQGLALERALVFGVEVLEALAGGEAGGAVADRACASRRFRLADGGNVMSTARLRESRKEPT